MGMKPQSWAAPERCAGSEDGTSEPVLPAGRELLGLMPTSSRRVAKLLLTRTGFRAALWRDLLWGKSTTKQLPVMADDQEGKTVAGGPARQQRYSGINSIPTG